MSAASDKRAACARAIASAIVALLFAAGCARTELPEPSVVVDERLGTEVTWIRGSAVALGQGLAFPIARVAHAPSGRKLVVLYHAGYRPFGEQEILPGRWYAFVVDNAGVVTELPSPPLGSPFVGVLQHGFTRDERPLLVVTGGPAGQLASVLTLEGTTWQRLVLPASERPLGAPLPLPEESALQVRSFSSDVVLFAYEGSLVLAQAGAFTSLPLPEGGVDVRLAASDDESVRVVFTDDDGQLFSARLLWDGFGYEDVQLLDSGGPFELATLLTSGPPSSSTLEIRSGGDLHRFVVGEGGGGLTEVASNDGRRLLHVPHPTRALRVEVSDAYRLEAVSVGVVTEVSFAAIPVVSGVSCADCSVDEHGIGLGEGCGRCWPREVTARFGAPAPDATGFTVLVQDFVNGGSRFAVKTLPLPFHGASITEAAEPGPFPGDSDGGPIDPTTLVVAGEVLLVGALNHGGTSVSIVEGGGGVVGSALTDEDGGFRVSGLTPGDYTLRWQTPLGLSGEQEVSGSGGGVVTLEPLVAEVAAPTGVGASWTPVHRLRDGGGLFRDGLTLYVDDGSGTAALSSALHLGPPVVERSYGSNRTLYFNEGDCASSCPLVRAQLVEGAAPVVEVLSSHFPIEGLTFEIMAALFTRPDAPTAWLRASPGGPPASAGITADALYVVASEDTCYGSVAFNAAPGGFDVEVRAAINGVGCLTNPPLAAAGGPYPALSHVVSHPRRAQVMGFVGTGCGQTSPCEALIVDDTGVRALSDVIALAPPYALTFDGSAYALVHDGAAVLTDVDVSTALGPNERALYVDRDGSYAFWRGAEGLWGADSFGSLVLVHEDAVRVQRLRLGAGTFDSVGVLVWTTPAGDDCSAGCDLYRLTFGDGLNPGALLLDDEARGDEAFVGNDDSNVVLVARSWESCPGAPCDVVWREGEGGSEAVSRGRPLVDRSVTAMPLGGGAEPVLHPEGFVILAAP